MKWLNRVRCGVVAACCCLLLAGCAGDDSSEDDLLPSGMEPTAEALGLRLVPVALDLAGLSSVDVEQVARGSYLVNGLGNCSSCHTTAVGYLAGGLPLGPVVSRNLTPDAETGMQLTEDEFVESMRTGKDFTDSTDADPQRLIVQPWHIFRFLSTADLAAIFAFLRRIPPVRNEVRRTFLVPSSPLPFPSLGAEDPVNDPDSAERGLRIPEVFSSGPAAADFLAQFNDAVASLSPEERAKVGRGSYLVNAIMNCNACHTDGNGDGEFDNGLQSGTVDVNTTLYLAGGVDIGTARGLNVAPLFSRNLTPATGGGGGGGGNGDGTGGGGLSLTEAEFIQTIRFGADFRRPGGSLRLSPHFPTLYHLTLNDLQAIFAYLQALPPVSNRVEIVP